MHHRSLVLIPLALLVPIGLFFALRPEYTSGGLRERDVEASVEGGAMEPSEEAVELHVHGYDLEEEAPRLRGGWPGVRKTGRASPG